jgi:putative nucleotidyltransferase with HDIG domain
MALATRIDFQSLIKDALPQLPSSALRVTKITQDLNAPAHALVDAIGCDPVLTARILRAANSSLYALERRVTSIPVALNALGTRAIHQLVLTYAAADAFNRNGKQTFAERSLWRHSVAVAAAAKEICLSLRRRNESETAFLCGLLHDVGKLLLIRYDPEYQTILDAVSDEHEMLTHEQEVYGHTHSQIGALVAHHWGLGDEITDVLFHHHHPRQSKRFSILACIVNVADHMANLALMSVRPVEQYELMTVESTVALGLSEAQLKDIWEKTEIALDEMMQLLSALI